jgi:hypothetical protein
MAKHKLIMEDFGRTIRHKIASANMAGEPKKEMWLVYSLSTEHTWFSVEFEAPNGWEKDIRQYLPEAIKLYNEI